MKIDLNNKVFRSLENSDIGEVGTETIFRYFQDGNIIWAEYDGGSILKGSIIGKSVGDYLEFTYQHINKEGELMTGKCISYPSLNEKGKIILKESWQWTCKDESTGESVLLEV